MLLFIEIVLKSEIRFSDSLCRDICIVRELPAERILRLQNWVENQGCRRPLAPGKRTLQGPRTRVFRAHFGNSKAALERPARNRGFPASELLFSPRQAPILPDGTASES